MPELVLIRHGQSVFNLENRFTGWLDVALSAQGETEAREAGRRLKAKKFVPAVCFTSELQRAQRTLSLILSELGINDIEIIQDKALNERNYGELQGKDKAETAAQFGHEQVQIWRRSFDVRPPGGESLADTAARTLPYFDDRILPELGRGKNVLIVAHGNSLRSIVMKLENMTPDEILKTEIGTGVAWIYGLRASGELERLEPRLDGRDAGAKP